MPHRGQRIPHQSFLHSGSFVYICWKIKKKTKNPKMGCPLLPPQEKGIRVSLRRRVRTCGRKMLEESRMCLNITLFLGTVGSNRPSSLSIQFSTKPCCTQACAQSQNHVLPEMGRMLQGYVQITSIRAKPINTLESFKKAFLLFKRKINNYI